MYVEELNVAANTENVATSQTDSTVANTEGTTEPTAQQDITQTQAFARRLKEETQRSVDAEYSRLYGESNGIHTKADYDKAIAEQARQQEIQDSSEKYNADPELMSYIKSLEDKVNGLENMTKAEKESIQREQSISKIKQEVNLTLEKAKADGVNITEEQLLNYASENGITDMNKVYKLLKPDVDMKTVKENAIKEYIEGLRNGRAPIEGGGSSPAIVAGSPKTFEEARKGALGILRSMNK